MVIAYSKSKDKALISVNNNNSDDKSRYEQTKRELAAKEWSDMDVYADAKLVI
jgi:GrpB-like predicted nucleotidyltransferase (UPF0157 family)